MMISPGAPAPPPAMPGGRGFGPRALGEERDRHRRGRAAFDQHFLSVAAAELAFAAGAGAEAPVVHFTGISCSIISTGVDDTLLGHDSTFAPSRPRAAP